MRIQKPLLLAIFRLLLIGAFFSTAATAKETATANDQKTLGIDALFQIKSVRNPQISPKGDWIAYVISQKNLEKDRSFSRIWMQPAGGGQAIAMTAAEQSSSNPRWSPDSKHVTHPTITNFEAVVYATSHLSVSDSSGGDSRVLTEKLDRMISKPQFTPDGKNIWFMLEDNGQQNLAAISPKGGSIDRLISGESVVYDFAIGKKFAAPLISTPQQPAEVFHYSGKQLQQLSFANQDWMKDLSLGEVEAVHYDSADGTRIDGFVIKPPGFVEGKSYPAILDIHGGPQSQYNAAFSLEAQIYAAQGYLVIHPNPRGSTGKGEAFCLGIWQAWGEPDYEDVMAAVDDAIARGWADPDRLAVTGWSYGGMLTNHVITKTDRFKAAISGASSTLYAVNYGHDMYQRWWEQELGLPWEPEARARYEAISPFNNLANVVTPTLIMGGEIDWNVPIINSEQLYLALKKLGVETQLVVYPGEYHGIDTPSHTQDLYQRYLAWFKKHLPE